MKRSQRQNRNDCKKRVIRSSVFRNILKFWSKHICKYFTIYDAMNFLADKHSDDEMPSYSTVLLYLKKNLKWVIKVYRQDSWKYQIKNLYLICWNISKLLMLFRKKASSKCKQMNSLSMIVAFPNMWRSKIWQSRFMTRSNCATKYSVISAISDYDIEASCY